jgi:HK97 family phage major capsid protein/HK97 family phage prohead protease
MTHQLALGRLTRDCAAAEIRVARADGVPLRLQFPVSSETPVARWFGLEVLSHDPKAVQTGRIDAKAMPLLFNHDWDDPIGMVDGGAVIDGRLWVDTHLFDTARAREIAAMIDGGLRNVSVGYEVEEMQENGSTLLATSWTPIEASIVTVPADYQRVGIGRSEADVKTVRIHRAHSHQPAAARGMQETTMTDHTANAAGATAATEDTLPAQPRQAPSALELENARQRGIRNLCRANKIADDVRDNWIAQGLSLEIVTDDLLKIIEQRSVGKDVSRIGLTPAETQQFSLFRAINAITTKDWSKAGFELECSRAIAAKLNRHHSDPQKLFVPMEVQEWQRPVPANKLPPHMREQRDLTVGTATAGGYLVETQNVSFIEMLRNRMVTYRMGGRRLPGLDGNVTIPRQTGAATPVWLANEASTITESQQTLGQLALSPKNVGAYTEVSRQLMLQSSPAVESVVMADLAQVLAIAIDAAVLSGSGAGGQPTGITNTAGIGSVTGTTLGYAGLLEFQTDVAGANVQPLTGGYVTTPTVAALMMQRVKFTGTASPCWEGNVWDGQMCGFRAMSSLQMAAATMLFGDWSQVIVGEWGTLELDVNPYANFQAAITGFRAIVTIDCGLRYAGAFALASTIT